MLEVWKGPRRWVVRVTSRQVPPWHLNPRSPPPPRTATAPGPSPSCRRTRDRKSTRLNSSHVRISYAVFCLKKKKKPHHSRIYEKKNTKTRATQIKHSVN